MKYNYIFLVAVFLLLLAACTKENEFMEESSWIGLTVNSTSANKVYEVWLNDELVQDSLTAQKTLFKTIAAGEYHLRIKQSGTSTYFVDTAISLPWSKTKYQFSLIELDPVSNPLFFSGFPEDIPPPEKGFATLAFMNIDPTITKDKSIDIFIYSLDNPNILLHKFENIPHNQISAYSSYSDNPNTSSGFLVIRDTETKDILVDGRDLYIILNLPYPAYPGAGNTFLVMLNNLGDDVFPFYYCEPIFEATR